MTTATRSPEHVGTTFLAVQQAAAKADQIIESARAAAARKRGRSSPSPALEPKAKPKAKASRAKPKHVTSKATSRRRSAARRR